ncbi:hypothetical protein [Deinococcus sp. QL22]|uniref:hypothetical protein n=1 Tax=Deinococcus sp. QL22 TaxID=2939437 RepID=UPI002017F5BB|nr:hypothetical protein [Deinococcus sp. QL22]UQN10712.1 hypothetical protein M1R55_30540 [Deinococcus sp. QL22]
MVRHPTPAIEARINGRFNLKHDPSHQDWPLEVSDGKRIEEFLDAYEQELWSDDERYAVMELILYSYEDHLHSDDQENLMFRDRLRPILLRDFELHHPTIEYWCRFDLSPEEAEIPEYLFTPVRLGRSDWRTLSFQCGG